MPEARPRQHSARTFLILQGRAFMTFHHKFVINLHRTLLAPFPSLDASQNFDRSPSIPEAAAMFSLISMGASSLVVPSRAGTISMAFPDNSWRKSYDGQGGASPAQPPVNQSPTAFSLGGGGGAAPAARAAAPAATGGATVVQAMKFMQDPSVTDMTVKIASQTHVWRHP